MKVFFSIILLLSICLKPIYFIGYVSYFEVNKEYIIEKYCVNKNKPQLKCNGKCHLSKKLTSINPIETSENEFKALVVNSFKNVFTPLFFSEFNLKTELPELKNYLLRSFFVPQKSYKFYLDILSPPPQLF